MEIRIPVHSFIDLITNSSTEVYISASRNAVKMAKELIQSILDSNKNGNVDESFDIYTEPNEDGEGLSLVIKSKGENENLTNKIINLFNIEATSNY